MSELGLDHVEWGGFVEEFDGECVSERVRVYSSVESGFGGEQFHEVSDVAGGEWASLAGGEDVRRVGECLEAGSHGDVADDDGHGGSVDGDVAAFVSLAVSDVEGGLVLVYVAEFEGEGFGDAEPGAPHDDDEGAVAEAGA